MLPFRRDIRNFIRASEDYLRRMDQDRPEPLTEDECRIMQTYAMEILQTTYAESKKAFLEVKGGLDGHGSVQMGDGSVN